MPDIKKGMELKSDRYYLSEHFSPDDIEYILNNMDPMDKLDHDNIVPRKIDLLDDRVGQIYNLYANQAVLIRSHDTGEPTGILTWYDDDEREISWIGYAATNRIKKTDFKFALVRGLKNMVKNAKYPVCADVLRANTTSLKYLERLGFERCAESETYITLVKENG